DRAAGAAGDPPAHPSGGARRRTRGDPAAGPPAAALRPAQRRDRPRAAVPRRECPAARARRRWLLPGATDRLRDGAAGAAAPPGPSTGRGRTRRGRRSGRCGRHGRSGRPGRPGRPRRSGRHRRPGWPGRTRARPARSPTTGGAGMSPLVHLPVFGLVLTRGASLCAHWLHHRTVLPGVLSPVVVTTAIVATVLLLTGLPYEVYLEQVSLLTMLLGPATVALA